LFLPSRLERGSPLRIRGAIAPFIHIGWCALKHIQLFGIFAEKGYALDCGRTRTNDCYALVMELVKAACTVTSGVVVIPAGGMETMSLEGSDARDARQLGFVQGPGGNDDK